MRGQGGVCSGWSLLRRKGCAWRRTRSPGVQSRAYSTWAPGTLQCWVREVLVWRSLAHTRASFNAALGLLNARQREEWRKRELASNHTSFCLLWTHMSPLSQPFSSYRWTSSACLSLPWDCELLECKDAVSYSQLLPPCLAQTLTQGMCLLIVGEMNEQVHGWRKAVLLSMQRWEEGINLRGTFLWAFNIHPPLLYLGRNCCIALSSIGIWGGSDLRCGTAKRKR